ncbi:Histone H2B [Euphorbia peplus]|nr:Histone H2B [Euphorbia peplus]
MAPKKNQKKRKIGTVVRSTRKVVKETVEVSVLEAGDTQESTQENLHDVFSTEEIFEEEPVIIKNVPVQEDGEKDGERTEIPVEGPENGGEEEIADGEVENGGEEAEKGKIPVGEPEKGGEGGRSDGKEEEIKKEKVSGRGRKGGKVKMETGGGKGERGRKRKRSKGKGLNSAEESNYKVYVYRVLKQVHPELRISGRGMDIINSLMRDMFERIADEAAKLSQYTHRMTLSSREIQDAVKLILPGELGKHAIAEGSKAVTNYVSYNPNK